MKSIKNLAIFLILFVNTLSFSQTNTEKYFSLNDTVFEINSIFIVNAVYGANTRLHYCPEMFCQLDSIISFLKQNPQLKVQIEVYSDLRGSEDMNQSLSEGRAKNMQKYFVEKGITKQQINYVGKGETFPFIADSTINKKHPFIPINQEITFYFINSLEDKEHKTIAHSLNRRTYLRIIAINK